MTIALADIKIRQSQRMTDYPDGGGLMVAAEVVDGAVNNAFDDVSRTDRSNGDCSLRKIFPHCSSANTDRLLDGHVIITENPSDPLVSLCLVQTGGSATERVEVRSALETTGWQITETITDVQPIGSGNLSYFDTASASFAVGQNVNIDLTGHAVSYHEVISVADLGGGVNRIRVSPAARRYIGTDPGDTVSIKAVTGAPVAATQPFATGKLAGDTVIALASVKARIAPDVIVGDETADIIGINPVAVGGGGLRQCYKIGSIVVIFNEQDDTMPSPLSASQMVQLSRTNLAKVTVADQSGADVPAAGYWTVDLALGQITFDAALDLTGYTEPLVVTHRIEDRRSVEIVDDTTDEITLDRGLSRDFGADSFAASAVYLGNMQARYTGLRDLQVWASNFDDAGTEAGATYDDATYPVEVNNLGAQSHKWAIVFTTDTTFQVHNEDRGIIASGNIGADLTVNNNQTGQPYFTLRAAGWGSGWVQGNALLFETIAAAGPVWLCRVVQPGDAAVSNDQGTIEFRGDAE